VCTDYLTPSRSITACAIAAVHEKTAWNLTTRLTGSPGLPEAPETSPRWRAPSCQTRFPWRGSHRIDQGQTAKLSTVQEMTAQGSRPAKVMGQDIRSLKLPVIDSRSSRAPVT
jgi:hypothetical protein